MKVKVTQKGFYESSLWYPGDVLNVPDDFKASWVEPVVEAKAEPVVAAAEPVEEEKKPKPKQPKKAAKTSNKEPPSRWGG